MTTRSEWHFTRPEGEEVVRVNNRFSVNNSRTVRQAVLEGQGIAVTPILLVGDYIKKGQMKIILDMYVPTSLEVHTIYPTRRLVPARVLYFIEYIRNKLVKKELVV